jgi:hypothetical protein
LIAEEVAEINPDSGALSSGCLDLRTVKRLSKLVVSPCQEKQLHRERLASHRTVRYYFVIAVRRAKKQNPQRDVLASNAGNLGGGAVGVDGACRGLQNH